MKGRKLVWLKLQTKVYQLDQNTKILRQLKKNSRTSQHLKANINHSVRTRGGGRVPLLLCVCGSKVSLLPSILWNSPYSYLSWLGILLSLCNSLHPILLLHFQCFGGAGRAAEGRGNGCYSQTTQGTAIPQQKHQDKVTHHQKVHFQGLVSWTCAVGPENLQIFVMILMKNRFIQRKVA